MRRALMFHGWGFPPAIFSSLIDELTSGFVVETPARTGYEKRPQQSADTIAVALQSPTLLVGWSLGGQDALKLSLQQPELVSGVVLLATTPCFVNQPGWNAGMGQAVFNAFREQVNDDPVAAMQQFVRLNAGDRADRQSRARLSELSGDVPASVLLNGLDELEVTDLRDSVSSIRAPVLILHAVDDRIVPVAASYWLQRHLPNARHVEFARGGHAFFLQHANEIADLVRAMA